MTVTATEKDLDRRTLTITSEFAAPVGRVWQVWADPRRLERWWGPPGFPATFVDHDLSPGARCTYFMTSPEGERFHGWWRILSVDAPNELSFEDGFADADAQPVADMPVTHAHVRLEPIGDGTRMVITSTFATLEQMEQLVAMQMVEGITLALGQIDGILAA